MMRVLWLVRIVSLACSVSAPLGQAPNSTGRLATGKGTSDGLNFELNVYYSLHEQPDCTADPDDQITAAPGECKCLYHLLGVCVASVKLGIMGSDEKITAQMWALDMCSGKPLVNDDGDWECNSCNVAAIGHSAGIAVQFVCPFTGDGLCQAVGIEVGENCIIASALVAAAFVCCICCCLYRLKANRDPFGLTVQAEYAYVQAEHAAPPPLLGGSE